MDSTFKSLYEAVSLNHEPITIELVTETDEVAVVTVRSGNFERSDTLVLPEQPESIEEMVKAQLSPEPAVILNTIISDLLSAYSQFYVRPNDPDADEYLATLNQEQSA